MSDLCKWFTNLHSNVFGIIELPEVVKGALLSRYSRTSASLRDVYANEFAGKHENADAFYERVLIGYGDDSIAELGNAQIACEDISLLAAKALEDTRIGLSFIEKSTRYVDYSQQPDGKRPYYIPSFGDLEKHRAYCSYMDACFKTYSLILGNVEHYLQQEIPQIKGQSSTAYHRAIKAKAFDMTRGLLPLGAITNVGINGNGRAYEALLTKLYTQVGELSTLADRILAELSKTINPFVKRVTGKYGVAHTKYLTDRRLRSVKYLAEEYTEHVNPLATGKVRLYNWSDELNAMLDVAEFIIREAGGWPDLDRLSGYIEDELLEIINDYVGDRQVRQHKVGRAFETVRYKFEIQLDIGAWRDLQRHRCLLQAVSQFAFPAGAFYYVPEFFEDTDVVEDYIKAMEEAQAIYEELQTPYVVPLAAGVLWSIDISLREAVYLCELRSGEQGHESYRRVAVEIYNKISEVHPKLAAACFKFVSTNNTQLPRLKSELKQERLRTGNY